MKKANYLNSLLLMLAFLLSGTAAAHDFEVNGIYYNFNGNEVMVTYRGADATQYLDEYVGDLSIPTIVTYNGITYSVTSIGSFAFSGCTGLTSVKIGNSVTNIGEWAFFCCPELTSIEIPNSVTSIGYDAFRDCTGLTSIEIPNSVTSIGSDAFSGCTGLTSIEIPNSVTSIGSDAFFGCTGLTSVKIGNSVTSIGSAAFFGCCEMTNITVESGNTFYDSRGNCNAIIETATNTLIIGCKNTVIPNSVTSIGGSAFSGCTGLTSIEIPNSVTNIGSRAFLNTAWYNNQLDGVIYAGLVAYEYKGTLSNGTHITLRDGTKGIASGAFYNCSGLSGIVIPNSVTNIGSIAFSGCSGLTSIEIPNSVTSIGGWAFSGCTGLTSIEIPNSVTSIGSAAFSGCCEMTNITVESGNTFYDSRGNCNAIIETATNTLIIGCKNTVIPNSVTSIGGSAFSGCTGLTSIEIPNSVTSIGRSAFDRTGLTRIYIGNSVTDISNQAFYAANLSDIYCYAITPATCFNSTFATYSATLHVPAASLAAYFTAPYWCNFENIVGDAVVPTGISISNDTVDIQLNEQITLTATVTPANASNNVVSWYSTNTTIATVNNGTITANSIGECDIIASCFGMKDTCHITVTNLIKLDQQEAMLLPNHMLTLTPNAPVMPEGFITTSSDPTVAAVRIMNGKVQVVGIKEGITTITVDSSDGTAQSATCLVTVYTEPGDLNSDGFVTIGDVTSLIDYILGGDEASVTMKNADVNGDGRINISDVTSLIDTILSKSE